MIENTKIHLFVSQQKSAHKMFDDAFYTMYGNDRNDFTEKSWDQGGFVTVKCIHYEGVMRVTS